MASYFFLVVTSFWILKPLKKGLFLRTYDEAGLRLAGLHLGSAEAEQLAKLANLVVALLAAAAFTALARTLRRERLALAATGFFLVGHAVFAALLREPARATVWAFYLYGDLFSTLMVATFFAFLNDSVSPEVARRLYGPIGLGGVVGGFVGSAGVASLIERLDRPAWLLICFAAGVAIAGIAFLAGRLRPRAAEGAAPRSEPAPTGGLAEAAGRVASSRYLLALVAIVGLYEITSTLLDFQFTSSVALHLDGSAIDAHVASVFAVTNAVALAVQLVVTPLVLTKLGVRAGLLALPTAALLAEGAFAAAPTLAAGSALSVADNGLNYSLQQSSREALYVPLSRAEKYQAKAVIDMVVQRAGKVVAIAVALGASFAVGSTGLRWLALPAALVLAASIFCSDYAGRRFAALSEGRER
jgi:AAA family ATP:ADP antiporter